MTTATKDELEQIHILIKGPRIAVLTTETEDGRLVSRPLATIESESDGTVWFFAPDDSEKVHRIKVAKAVVTGGTPDVGENHSVSL